MVTEYLSKNPVKDDEIKAEYEKVKTSSSGKEYHARHILVEKEDEAKGIIEKLKGGAKFEELAKVSKDPGSAEQGGDLGWAPSDAFVKPFSEAMMSLKAGDVTPAPVKTQFGFHVIKLEETRDSQLPPFDQVKAQIAESLQQRKLQTFQQDLKKKAKIKKYSASQKTLREESFYGAFFYTCSNDRWLTPPIYGHSETFASTATLHPSHPDAMTAAPF